MSTGPSNRPGRNFSKGQAPRGVKGEECDADRRLPSKFLNLRSKDKRRPIKWESEDSIIKAYHLKKLGQREVRQ